MDYKVSEKVMNLLEEILAMEEVKRSLQFIEDDQENTLNQQIDICKVQAPTFFEKERAEYYKKHLEDLGLQNVHIDEKGNTIGILEGSEESGKILMEGHLDTVFPLGTVIEPKIHQGNVYAPGICDDTRGLVVCLSAIRAFKELGLKTRKNLMFAGTVEEEGIGGLGGMKSLLETNKDIEASISVDGYSAQGIGYQGTGMRTYEINFYGLAGHAYLSFGELANPLHAAARAVAKIADFTVPEFPRTTYCVSNFHAGSDSAIHAIVNQATIKINFRSDSMEELEKLDDMVKKACQEAADEETKRWNKNQITWDFKLYLDVPVGMQDEHAPIVEALHAIIEKLDLTPVWIKGGCTNANIPIGSGKPAVCVGMGGDDTKLHSLDEYFPIEGSYKGVQQAFLLALMLAGIDGRTPSVLEI